MSTAHVLLQGTAGPVVDLIKGYLNYSGPIELPQYFVERYAIEDRYQSGDMSEDQYGVRIEIALGRRLLNQLLTTFLPTTCICMVAFSTNFFRVCLIMSLLINYPCFPVLH